MLENLTKQSKVLDVIKVLEPRLKGKEVKDTYADYEAKTVIDIFNEEIKHLGIQFKTENSGQCYFVAVESVEFNQGNRLIYNFKRSRHRVGSSAWTYRDYYEYKFNCFKIKEMEKDFKEYGNNFVHNKEFTETIEEFIQLAKKQHEQTTSRQDEKDHFKKRLKDKGLCVHTLEKYGVIGTLEIILENDLDIKEILEDFKKYRGY